MHTKSPELAVNGYFRTEDLNAELLGSWDTLCFGKDRQKQWGSSTNSAMVLHTELFRSGDPTAPRTSQLWALIDPSIAPFMVKDSPLEKSQLARTKVRPGPVKKQRRARSGPIEHGGQTPIEAPITAVSPPPMDQETGDTSNQITQYTEPVSRRRSSRSTSTLDTSTNLLDLESTMTTQKSRKKKKDLELEKSEEITDFEPTDAVFMSKENTAPQLQIFRSNVVKGEKGYRMSRSNVGVSSGAYFFEVEILPTQQGHVRLGVSTEKGDIQAPVGYDHYSYSYRDVDGAIFHQSRSAPYASGYGQGDVIGVYIYLPPSETTTDPPVDAQYIQIFTPQPPGYVGKMAPVEKAVDGCVGFFLNGNYLGDAFTDIGKGTYYAAVSLYMGAKVKVNFGPAFRFPPSVKECLPFCYLGPTQP
ncbi:set1/Ash2 histone methyltransferase complex subunit ASH2 [Pelomyxa schiedti]|nr:set1/Ash2 histone methyltransferase complex subunit ASH2 [Pelomyxa schiedti]